MFDTSFLCLNLDVIIVEINVIKTREKDCQLPMNIIKIVKDLLGITAKNTIKNITWTQESVTWETKEITGMKGIEKIDSKSFFIEKEIIYVHCSSNNNIVNNHCE